MHKKKTLFITGEITPAFIADSIAKHQAKTEIGAHGIFLGQVRADTIGNATVTGIEFQAYQEMAEDKMIDLRERFFAKYDLTCMHVYHSIGWVSVGQICFFVFTSSKHREMALNACEEIVNTVKAELPIWGKEVASDDTFRWKQNRINNG